MIYDILKQKYIDSGKIYSLLKDSEISVLSQFLENEKLIKRFNGKYYHNSYPQIVLCGINPGKYGAGKTGIPFLDFDSLSNILENVNRKDTEKSAQFFFEVVKQIGVKTFYENFYVTNISWVGYIKNNKNFNYYKLPVKAKDFVLEMFKLEMEIISPQAIIPMSKEVSKTVEKLFANSKIHIEEPLSHPYYCTFPKRRSNCKSLYINRLSKYLKA